MFYYVALGILLGCVSVIIELIFINFYKVLPLPLIELSGNRVEVLEIFPVYIIWYSNYPHQDDFSSFYCLKQQSKLPFSSPTLPTWQYVVWGWRFIIGSSKANPGRRRLVLAWIPLNHCLCSRITVCTGTIRCFLVWFLRELFITRSS